MDLINRKAPPVCSSQRNTLALAAKVTLGRRVLTINELEEEGWVAVSSIVEKKRIATFMDGLTKVGAKDILDREIANTSVGYRE